MKMSEPDHGTSFTSRSISGVENPVVPLRSGLCSQSYKPVDYQHLWELAAAEKLTSAKIQLKIKKTEQVSKINKEQMLLKQHRQVWWREHKRLSENRQKVEADIKTFLDEESHKHGLFSDVSDLESKLSKEWDAHQANTVAPIWQLREELRSRLCEMQCHLPEESPLKSTVNPLEMLQQIESVKKQQKEILEFLALERLALERELEEYKPEALARSLEETDGLVLEVPSALLSLECPCPHLKTLIIDEYRKLAGAYCSRLQEIDEQLQASYRDVDWTEEDEWVFQTVIHQYPRDLQRRRMLYLDALQRYLPHKSRHELVVHEKAWGRCQSGRSRRRALLLAWARARSAFLLGAVASAAEASAAQQEQAALAGTRLRQQRICAHLKAKVLQWKAQQEEAARLEAAGAARRREEQDEAERLQKEREMVRRAQEKEKVKKFWAEKQRKWQEQEEKDLQRLEEFRKLMAEQAVRDRERVGLKAKIWSSHSLQPRNCSLKVAVVAKLDPARAVADTVASRARVGIGAKEEFHLQKPLFELHTYSEQQIVSDPRLRVELALREAGLHGAPYAREVLPKIPPPKLPRRDMESTAFEMESTSQQEQKSLGGVVRPIM
ncbi:coiled-coil domain-containing protein 148 [Patagioenas fasciata monilis]|uniref:Coiled-coil domain-containing protein 148 n=1 Tax=Patagioenas fasciata monilis TaxID=372326 RepID=A0A1V4K596_PATFA|nr:coiled-coil domain-containing protein 148 [Patagioenas fasciata monilis]